MTYYRIGEPELSQCAAEWFDVHRAFNPAQPDVDAPSTIHLLPLQLESPPNVIRLRFEVSDNDGVHQVQLSGSTRLQNGQPGLIACKNVNGSRHSTVEFIYSPIQRESHVTLKVIDFHGNLSIYNTDPLDITPLVPNPKRVSFPDPNLAVAVRESLGLNVNDPITQLDMISLKRLIAESAQIADIRGLEHAISINELRLNSNQISDLTPLAGLTNLIELHLHGNRISNVTPLLGLINLRTLVLSINQINDLTPLAGLTNLTGLHLYGNRINDLTPLSGLINLWRLVP